MEILFENTYVRNKEMAKEIYRYYFFRRKGMIILYILCSLALISDIVNAIFEDGSGWYSCIIIPLLLLYIIISYFRTVNLTVKRDAEIHGKEITTDAIVTEDYIQNTLSTGAVISVEYSKIKKAAQTKNLILLFSDANLIYIFRKDGFTKGTTDEFIAFLKSKGIKV